MSDNAAPTLEDEIAAANLVYKGAMARFTEIGVPADRAHRLYIAKARKTAAEHGIAEPVIDLHRVNAAADKVAAAAGVVRQAY